MSANIHQTPAKTTNHQIEGEQNDTILFYLSLHLLELSIQRKELF